MTKAHTQIYAMDILPTDESSNIAICNQLNEIISCTDLNEWLYFMLQFDIRYDSIGSVSYIYTYVWIDAHEMQFSFFPHFNPNLLTSDLRK